MSRFALPAAVNARGYNISVSISSAYFPFLRCGNQSSAHRIGPKVIPFFTITLVGTQNVIEELALPQHGLS
jgi:hypothetical protein